MGRNAKYDWDAFLDRKKNVGAFRVPVPASDSRAYTTKNRLRSSFTHWRAKQGRGAEDYRLHIEENGPDGLLVWITPPGVEDPKLLNPGAAALAPEEIRANRALLLHEYNALAKARYTMENILFVERDIGWRPSPNHVLMHTPGFNAPWNCMWREL